VFTAIAIFTNGYTSVLFIAALGFSNSIMWPAIWPLAIGGLGRFTKLGSAFMIMAIAGGATIPLLYGYLADLPHVGTTLAYAILIPCYLIIFFFATWGYKIGRSTK
jgi:fucose permease